jgi:glycolate oxidase iron-sulfur subunit
LPACPTYLETGVEMASPRGRLYMMRALSEGKTGLSPEFVKHLDQCLGCLACQEMCPSGVPYGPLLEEARTHIAAHHERSCVDRLWRRVLLLLFPYPQRLGMVIGGLSVCQGLGLARLVRAGGWLARLSPRLAEMEGLLPPLPRAAERRPLPELTPAMGRRRARVGLLTGCAQRFLLPEINRATVRVLAAAGYDVVAPHDQGCCGALHLHAGELAQGRALARTMIATFERRGVDFVVANAGGCGATMKGYGTLLAEEAEWCGRAEAFSGKVRDVSEILSETSFAGRLRPLPLTVTYHDACHLAHAQGIRKEPRHLLEQIPELTVIELAESDVCCGSGGVYNLLQPDMAASLLKRKVDHIQETGAGLVAAGNIGCLLHIRHGLAAAGASIRAVHPVEVLDWALNGEARRGESTEPNADSGR